MAAGEPAPARIARFNSSHLRRVHATKSCWVRFDPAVKEELRAGRLVRVLEEYAPTVPGIFLYFPSRVQRSGPLRLFIEAAKEFVRKAPSTR